MKSGEEALRIGDEGIEMQKSQENSQQETQQQESGFKRYETDKDKVLYESGNPAKELEQIIRTQIETVNLPNWSNIDDFNQMMIIKFLSEFQLEAIGIKKEFNLGNIELDDAKNAVQDAVEEALNKPKKLPEDIKWEEKEQYVFSSILGLFEDMENQDYQNIEAEYARKYNLSESKAKFELKGLIKKVLPLIITTILLLTFGYSEIPDTVLADFPHELVDSNGVFCEQIKGTKLSGDVYKNLDTSSSLRSLLSGSAGGMSSNCKIKNLAILEEKVGGATLTSLNESAVKRELSRIRSFKRRLEVRTNKKK